MRLAAISVPYRAFHRGLRIVFLGLVGISAGIGAIDTSVVIGIVALALLFIVLYEYTYYTRFTYTVTADTFDICSGIISRREREIPYGRIQNVDVSQSIVQRVLGIAEVNFETAGGSQTEGSLQFVTVAEADRLQRTVQERKRDTEADHSASEAGVTERSPTASDQAREEMFAITPHELVLKGALSFDPRIFGATLFIIPGSASFLLGTVPGAGPFGVSVVAIVGALGLVVAAWILGIVVAVLNYHGFKLTQIGDELRYERGLLRRYSGSIPLSKLQALSVTDNPLMRVAGYASLSIETAGYAPGHGAAGGSQAAIPIAHRDRVLNVADDLATPGNPTFVRPPARVRGRYAVRYLIAATAVVIGLFIVSRMLVPGFPWYGAFSLFALVPVAAHYKWLHRGYWLGEHCVLTRNGFWRRKTTIVPYYRIQTVIDSRTVLQRRWDLSTVVIDTAGGSSLLGRSPAAVDIESRNADRLRGDLTEQLQEALTRQN